MTFDNSPTARRPDPRRQPSETKNRPVAGPAVRSADISSDFIAAAAAPPLPSRLWPRVFPGL